MNDAGLPVALPVAWLSTARLRTSGGLRGRSGSRKSPTSGGPGAATGPTGHRQLQRVSHELSQRDWQVLQAVDAHRFLRTQHVERLKFHDHTSALSGARTARRVLRRLASLGLLQHLDRRVGGIRAGSAGYVWQLSAAGHRLLRGVDHEPTYRSREPSLRLLDHYLAIAECRLALIEAGREHALDVVKVELEPDSWRRYLGSGGEPRLLRPDLYVVTADGDYEDHWFVEVDLGSEHPPTVVRKCQAYLNYQRSGREQADLGLFPRVVWQVANPARAERLQTAFSSARLEPSLFRITTPERLVSTLAGGAA